MRMRVSGHAEMARCVSAARTTDFIREYQGVEHIVTVTRAGYEYAGQPYQSLSAIARAITGTRWNGRVFFGLRPSRSSA